MGVRQAFEHGSSAKSHCGGELSPGFKTRGETRADRGHHALRATSTRKRGASGVTASGLQRFLLSRPAAPGSALAPALPGQDLREALWLPHFPVGISGKRSGSRTSRSGSPGSALPPTLPGRQLRPPGIQLFTEVGEVLWVEAEEAGGFVSTAVGFLEGALDRKS